MEPAFVRTLDRNHVVGTWDRVLIQVWRGEVTPDAVQRLAEAGRDLVGKHEGAVCSSLSVIESTSPPPNDRVRPLLSSCYRELAKGMPLQLFVAEGSGFRAAIVRGVGVAVSTFAPSLLPFKFASTVREAALAIAPRLSPRAGGSEALVKAIAELRRKLDQQAPAP
jgi:hypothetical protein